MRSGSIEHFKVVISPQRRSDVDHRPCLPCRARRPFSAERRPKFISVTVLVARFWECSTPSNWFNLYGNCYNPVYAACRGDEALGYARRSPLARAIPDYFFKDISVAARRPKFIAVAAGRGDSATSRSPLVDRNSLRSPRGGAIPRHLGRRS
jgi:hypothetical protein